MRVTVIDYKAGNLTSVLKALRHLGADPLVTDSDLSVVESAEQLVLPGVGHFAATQRLDATGLTHAIRSAVRRGVPFLGICVGMQWLYSGSAEAASQSGLAHFAESCSRFPERNREGSARRVELASSEQFFAAPLRCRLRRIRLLHALIQGARHSRYRCGRRVHRTICRRS